MTELTLPSHPVQLPESVLTIKELTANVQRIQAAMKELMIGPSSQHPAGVHYGVIPGTDKPTLLKPGAELIATMFRLSAYPLVHDLSGADVIRYRVVVSLTHAPSAQIVGHGVGECSTDEEKYRWRRVVCDEEFDQTDPDRRREKFRKGKGGTIWKEKQMRTNPADAANTILKMAKKRALVDAVLTCTACSDIFQQDVEDLSPEMRTSIYGEEAPQSMQADAEPKARAEPAQQQSSTDAPPADTSGPAASKEPITPQMVKMLHGRMCAKAIEDTDFCSHFNVGQVESLAKSRINEAMQWIEAK